MAIKKVEIRHLTNSGTNEYDVLYPKTAADNIAMSTSDATTLNEEIAKKATLLNDKLPISAGGTNASSYAEGYGNLIVAASTISVSSLQD